MPTHFKCLCRPDQSNHRLTVDTVTEGSKRPLWINNRLNELCRFGRAEESALLVPKVRGIGHFYEPNHWVLSLLFDALLAGVPRNLPLGRLDLILLHRPFNGCLLDSLKRQIPVQISGLLKYHVLILRFLQKVLVLSWIFQRNLGQLHLFLDVHSLG